MSPRGTPKIGSHAAADPAPQPEVLGTITNPRITDPTPQGAYNIGSLDGVTVEITEPPPPWELDGGDYALSDARRYVDVPENWELRWINPKLLDQFGWRCWQPVMKSDPRVTVKVDTMVSPEGNVRRGGFTGDILAWMYKSWVEARRREQQTATRALTDSAARKQESLRAEFGRRGLEVEAVTHPRYTGADGREMRSRGD